MSFSTTRLYCRRAPRQSVWQFYMLPHMRQSWETMTSVSAGHIILTPTQPVGGGQPQRESNPGPPHQESRALPTELQPPPPPPPINSWGKEILVCIDTRLSASKLYHRCLKSIDIMWDIRVKLKVKIFIQSSSHHVLISSAESENVCSNAT